MVQGITVLLLFISIASPAFTKAATIQKALSLIEANQLDDATNQLNTLINESDNHQAQLLLTSVLLKKNQVSQALQVLQDRRQSLQKFPSYYNNLAYAYFYKGKDKLAIKTLQKGLQQNSDYNTLYENLSTIYAFMAKKAYEKAIDDTNKIQQELPQLKLSNQIQTTPPIPETKNISQKADLVREKGEIEKTLVNWSKAWSDQDSRRYLAFYSNAFNTPAGVSIKAWRKYRDERIRAPRFIKVKLTSLNVIMSGDGSLASVHFLQHYRSNTLNDKVIKHVVLQKKTDKWMIISENVAN